MTTYIGTKIIKAEVMNRGQYNRLRGWDVPFDENPMDEGYLVEYVDGGQKNHPDYEGYISWSPKDVFEKAYRPINGMTFGMAIEALRAGKTVTRKAWAYRTGACIRMEDGVLNLFVPFWLDGSINVRSLNADDLDKFDFLAEDWEVVL